MTVKSLFIIALTAVLMISCSSNPLDVDVSDVKLDLKFREIRTVLHNSDSTELFNAHETYKREIPEIYNYYLGVCMRYPENYSDSLYYAGMKKFQQDPAMAEFETAMDKKFSDLKPVEARLEDGFKHLKYHLPDAKLPEYIVFMNLHLTASIFCTDNEIGIGLERYLGPDSEPIKKLPAAYWYEWVKNDMKAEFMERDAVSGWVGTHIIEEMEGNLAEHIIRSGKILYLTKAAFPEMEDHLILRYTKEEWDWATKNEASFWKYLVDLNALFKSEELQVMNMINPGPTTMGLPEEGSPDRMGQYLGYKMVKNFMENSDVKVKELIDTPFNDILQEYEIEE